MRRMIPVINLHTGKLSSRPSLTPTFDLPKDFDRSRSVATVDLRSRARYLSESGKEVLTQLIPRPLSWRVRGEQCLVADHDGVPRGDGPHNFAVAFVDPAQA